MKRQKVIQAKRINHLQDYFNHLLLWQGLSKKKFFTKRIETKTKFSSSNPIENCDRLKLLLQEKEA